MARPSAVADVRDEVLAAGLRTEGIGLELVADELAKALRRADDVQRHARYLEHLLDGKPDAVGNADALTAVNADLRSELIRLRRERTRLLCRQAGARHGCYNTAGSASHA